MYVIVRKSDGKFVRPPGSEKSYTDKLQMALVWKDKEEAKRHCCSNEEVVPLVGLLLVKDGNYE